MNNLENKTCIIRFLQETVLEITINYDEKTDRVDTEIETFTEDETIVVDVFGDHGETMDIQFGNGDVAFAVPKSLVDITVVEEA